MFVYLRFAAVFTFAMACAGAAHAQSTPRGSQPTAPQSRTPRGVAHDIAAASEALNDVRKLIVTAYDVRGGQTSYAGCTLSFPSVLLELQLAGQHLAVMDQRLVVASQGGSFEAQHLIRRLRDGIRTAQDAIANLSGPPDVTYEHCNGITSCWDLKQECDKFECLESFFIACLSGYCHDEY